MKTCATCREEKPLTEFYRDKSRKDGYQHRCKPCHHKANREWSARRPHVKRAGQRRYDERHPGRWAQQPQEKRRARRMVNHEVEMGRLNRPSICPTCGESDSPIHAHHHDYSKPLEVQWVCVRCHARIHAEERSAA